MFRQTVAALAVAGCLVTPASARVLKYVTYSDGDNYDSTSGKNVILYEVNGPKRSVLAFRVPAKPTVVITFNAFCAFESRYNGAAWVDIDVIIDGGPPLPPTDSDQSVLCGQYTREGPSVTRVMSRTSIVVSTDLTPGLHNLTIVSRLRSSDGAIKDGEAAAWIGQSSLLIETGN